jgi:cytochrome c6
MDSCFVSSVLLHRKAHAIAGEQRFICVKKRSTAMGSTCPSDAPPFRRYRCANSALHSGPAFLAAALVSLLAVSDASALPLNERGAQLFENTCAACHAGGGNVIGFARNKTLKSKALVKYGYNSKESIADLLRNGKGVMPPYGKDKLSDLDVDNLAEFVLQAAERNWK